MYETITDSNNDKLALFITLRKAFTIVTYYSSLSVVEENKRESVCMKERIVAPSAQGCMLVVEREGRRVL